MNRAAQVFAEHVEFLELIGWRPCFAVTIPATGETSITLHELATRRHVVCWGTRPLTALRAGVEVARS